MRCLSQLVMTVYCLSPIFNGFDCKVWSVLRNRVYYLLRFRFRFDFWQVPVPGPAPYLNHKKQLFPKNFAINLAFLILIEAALLPRNLCHLLRFQFISVPDPLRQKVTVPTCAAKAIFYCPSMNSHRPRSQDTAKERTLIPEKDSKRKRPRSHVSLEKSSKNLSRWKN